MHRNLLSALAALLPIVPLSAQTVTVQLLPLQDNTLYEDPAGALSNGQGQFLFAGKDANGLRHRAVLAFDPRPVVPARSRIVAVEVILEVTQSNAAVPAPGSLHRVTSAWGESTSQAPGTEEAGGTAAPLDATWLHAFFPNTLWSSPGGDFVAAPSSTTLLPLQGSVTFPSSEDLTADVQDWLDGRPNHGWLLMTDEMQSQTLRKFASLQNNSLPPIRPSLRITYLPPGNSVSIGAGCATSGNQVFVQLLQGSAVRGGSVTLTTQSGVPLGLFVTLLSYDLRANPAEPEPGCFWHLREYDHANVGVRIQDLNGNLSETFPIPSDSALFGIPIALQSILVDWAHPRQWAISNANLLCIR